MKNDPQHFDGQASWDQACKELPAKFKLRIRHVSKEEHGEDFDESQGFVVPDTGVLYIYARIPSR